MRKHRARVIALQLRTIRANPWPWQHSHAWRDYICANVDPETY